MEPFVERNQRTSQCPVPRFVDDCGANMEGMGGIGARGAAAGLGGAAAGHQPPGAAAAGAAVFESWLTLPRTWCARFVKNREEAALVVALARAGIALDLLLRHHRKERDRARGLQQVVGVLHRRLSSVAGPGRGVNSCLPVAVQSHEQSRRGSAVLCSRLVETAERLRSLQQQLRQWVVMNKSVADELVAHTDLALRKRILADAEAQLADRVEQLLQQLPQPDPGLARRRLRGDGSCDSGQFWTLLGVCCPVRTSPCAAVGAATEAAAAASIPTCLLCCACQRLIGIH